MSFLELGNKYLFLQIMCLLFVKYDIHTEKYLSKLFILIFFIEKYKHHMYCDGMLLKR